MMRSQRATAYFRDLIHAIDAIRKWGEVWLHGLGKRAVLILITWLSMNAYRQITKERQYVAALLHMCITFIYLLPDL